MKDPYEIAAQIEGYLSNKLSPEEEIAFLNKVQADSYLRELLEHYSDQPAFKKRLLLLEKLDVHAAYNKVLLQANNTPRKVHPFSPYVRYAAAILVLAAFSMLLYQTFRSEMETKKRLPETPFSERSVELRLSNGKMLNLEKPLNMTVKNQYGLRVDARGLFHTRPVYASGTAKVMMNVLNVPGSKIYYIELTDGTKVWLNNGSRLSYPTEFGKTERVVSLQGEAFFEVSKNIARPFKVRLANADIVVLGTKFNVKAYSVPLSATLIEGSVSVENSMRHQRIRPGQQAILENASIKVRPADINKVLSWRRGEFHFDNDDLHEIMEQLARWYGLQVIYGSNLPKLHYSGRFPRSYKISKVAVLLSEITGLRITLDNNIIKIDNKPSKS